MKPNPENYTKEQMDIINKINNGLEISLWVTVLSLCCALLVINYNDFKQKPEIRKSIPGETHLVNIPKVQQLLKEARLNHLASKY